MELKPGDFFDATVKSIASFGAFVTLPGGENGLVHISEISEAYVTDIHQVLKEGQSVRVKLLRVDENGRISLSIKQANKPAREKSAPVKAAGSRKPQKAQPATFEDKLKQFMADSDSKMAGLRQYEHRSRTRRR